MQYPWLHFWPQTSHFLIYRQPARAAGHVTGVTIAPSVTSCAFAAPGHWIIDKSLRYNFQHLETLHPLPQTPWKGVRAHRHSKGPSVCSPVFRISIGITWCGLSLGDGIHRGCPWTGTASTLGPERGGQSDSPRGILWALAAGASSAPPCWAWTCLLPCRSSGGRF